MDRPADLLCAWQSRLIPNFSARSSKGGQDAVGFIKRLQAELFARGAAVADDKRVQRREVVYARSEKAIGQGKVVSGQIAATTQEALSESGHLLHGVGL